MKKHLILPILLTLAFFVNISFADTHHKIKINLDSKINKQNFLKYCSDILEFKGDEFIIAIVNDNELKKIQSENLNYNLIEKNLEEKYSKICKQNLEKIDDKMQYPSYFSFGSMGGYYTFQEAYKVFDQMKSKYPEYFVDEEIYGSSIEKRDLKCFIFGNKKLDKPKILLNSLIHAREGGGLTSIVYFLWNLFEKAKNGDPESQFLLNNREIYVIPVINPDGLVYNQQTNPEGGGMWRKNRRIIGSEYGVDLNRNFGPFKYWDSDNLGSSTDPKDVTYRGTAPFSEPETSALESYCLENDFKIAINYHTYTNDLIYPYSAIPGETVDSNLFRGMAIEMSKKNNYFFGTDEYTVGYGTRGSSDDWFYYTDSVKKFKTLGITPEVGNLDDGFWTTKERILDQCIENIEVIDNAIWSAEYNIKPIDLKIQNKFEKNQSMMSIKIQNIGVANYFGQLNIWINSLDNSYLFASEPIIMSQAVSGEINEFNVDLPAPNENFKNGSYVKFEVIIEQDHILRRDTFSLQLFNFQVQPLFANGVLVGNWDIGNWGFIYDENVGQFVLCDSKDGIYDPDTDNILTQNYQVKIDKPTTLFFSTYWQIETNYDFSTIEISTDNGASWENLKSSRMTSGSGIQSSKQFNREEYGFNGYFPIWIDQYIDLKDYIGKNVKFRFIMASDKGKHWDGIFYKSIELRKYDDVKFSDVEENDKDIKLLSYNENGALISIENNQISKINLTNILGEKLPIVYNLGNQIAFVDLHKIQSGCYFIEVFTENKIKTFKVIK